MMKVTVAGWSRDAAKLDDDLGKVEKIKQAEFSGTIRVSGPDELVRLGPFDSIDDVCDKAKKNKPLPHADVICAQVHWLNHAYAGLSYIRQSIKTIKDFDTAYKDIATNANEWHSVVPDIPYDATSITPQKITISKNQEFAAYYSESTKAFATDASRVGDLTISAGAFSAWHPAIAAGAIYSFVKTQKFSAMSNSSGGLVVGASTSNYAAVSGLVALNLTHDKYVDQPVQPFFQVGIAPDSKNLAFTLGAGLKLFGDAVISAGVIYQKIDTLASGLTVGGPLASTSALKTDSAFKTGVYIGLSYNVVNPTSKK
jgi:hypothetical protein